MVDFNNFNIVMGECVCCVQYIIVVINDYCEISQLFNFCECVSFYIFQLQFVSDLLFNDDFVIFCVQLVVEYFMCCQCSGVLWVFYNVNIFEMIIYFFEVFVVKIDDNVSVFFEILKLIFIISEVSEMNVKKMWRNL